MTESRDAYKMLQVDPEADLEVIQAAYRRLAQKYHPDRATTPEEAAMAEVRMVELNAAWAQLRDAERRAAYDRERSRSAQAPGRPFVPGYTPPERRRPGEPPTSASHSAPADPGPAVVPDAPGSAGRPPGRPSGSVINFGRYSGWSLGEIGRVDPGYLAWLDRMPIGRPYRAELDVLMRRLGLRLAERAEAEHRRGLFRRR